MSDKKIDFGLGPNTNTGDTNYEAFTKVEDRLEAAEAAIEEISSAVGTIPSNVRGIKSVLLNESSHLIITFTDDTTQDAGLVGSGTTTPPVSTGATFVSPSAQSQPGATLRFFQATLDRAATLTGISDNATIWDAANGLWSLKSLAVGDGSAARSAQVMLTATPADGSGAVSQTVTVSLNVALAPAQISEHAATLFTGDAGKKAEAFAGWALYGNAGPSNYATDGTGALVNDNSNLFYGSLLMSPSTASGLSGTITFGKSTNGGAEVALLSDGGGNAIIVEMGVTAYDGLLIRSYFAYKSGNPGVDYTDVSGIAVPWDADGHASLIYSVSIDKKTLKIGLKGSANTVTIDLTKYPDLGTKCGLLSGNWYGNPALKEGAKITSVDYAVLASTLTVSNAPRTTTSNQATYGFAWTGTKPTGIQHSFDLQTWFTGDSTVSADGTTSYTATSPSGGMKTPSFRMLNDTGVVTTAPNATHFMALPARYGINITNPGGFSPEFQVTADLFKNGYWTQVVPRNDGSGANDYIGYSDYKPNPGVVDANNMPLISGMLRTIGHSSVSGSEVLMTWTGAPNMGLTPDHAEGDASITNISRPDAQSCRFRYNFASGTRYNTFATLKMDFDPANRPENIKMIPVGQAAPKQPYWSDAFIEHHKTNYGIGGTKRFMDFFGVNDTRDVTFAEQRERIEAMIALCNATKSNFWVNVMMYGGDAYQTALLQAIDTGAGTSNGVALDSSLKIEVEDHNEIWNYGVGFTGYYVAQTKYQQRTGAPSAGNDGAVAYGQVMTERAWRYNKLMTLVKSAIPNWKTRVVRVLGVKLTDDAAEYSQFKELSGGSDNVDAVTAAPYFHYASGDATDAAAMTGWKNAAIASVRSARAIADAAYRDGKRFVAYEGGPDFMAANLSVDAAIALKSAPGWYDVIRAYAEEWRIQFGDLLCHYDDMAARGWGLLNYQGSTNSYALIAFKDAIAGNYAHKPS
jgi:hypothetical protein